MSHTYLALIVSVLSFGLPALGIEVVEEKTLTKTLTDLVGVGALLYAFYGRYKAGGDNCFWTS